MAKKRLGLWLCVAFLVALCLARWVDDRYLLTRNGYQLAGEAYGTADGRATVTGEAQDFALSGLWLGEGDYELVLDYEADAAGSALYAESERWLNADNTLGRRLAEAQLAPGSQQLVLPLAMARGDVRDLRVVVAYGGAGSLTITSLTVRSGPMFYTDHLLLALLVLGVGVFLDIWLFARKLKPGETVAARLKRLAPAAVVLAVGLFACYPLFTAGLSAGHDLDYHLTRVQGIADAWRDGQFPARVYPTPVNGKGYLSGAMYPDLFLWPSAALRLCGVSLMGCCKFAVYAINIATAATAWLAGRRLFASRWAAAATMVLYTLANYRILNVYIRAALGEALAMVFLPLAAAGLYSIFFGDEKHWGMLAVGFSGLVQSHVLTLLEAGLFAALFGLVFLFRLIKEKARLWGLLKAAGTTLALNLWYLIPFLWFSTQDLGVYHNTVAVWANAITPAQLFMGTEAAGALAPQMHLSPGLPLLVCGGALLLFLLFGAKRQDEGRLWALGGGCFAFAALALLLCTTAFPWRWVARLPFIGPLLSSIQFPWRFLSIASVLLALCGGVLASLLMAGSATTVRGQRLRVLGLAALFALCAIGPMKTMDAALNNPDAFTLQSSPNINHIYDGQYLYAGSDDVMLVAGGNDIKGDAAITDYTKNGLTLRFTAAPNTTGGAALDLPLVWYPGYTATDADGNALPVARQESGLAQVTLPGPATVTVRYTGPGWLRIFDFLSLAAIAGLVVLTIRKRRKHRADTTVPHP